MSSLTEIKERFYEIGSPKGLDETINFFKEQEEIK